MLETGRVLGIPECISSRKHWESRRHVGVEQKAKGADTSYLIENFLFRKNEMKVF